MLNDDNMNIRFKYERIMEHEKWNKEIPFLKFPTEWMVKVSPPSVGAVVRFQIKKGEAWVSIYLDCYENLGFYGGKPYWEVYPYNDDTFRCGINDTDELLNAITQSLVEQGE